MGRVTEFRFLARALLGQQGLAVGGRLVGRVAAPLAMEVNARIARVIRRYTIAGLLTLGRKLLSDAQASISVPSTVKCSSLVSFNSRASATTVRKNSPATSCSSKRVRLRLKVEWSKPGSSQFISKNQRNKGCSPTAHKTSARCAPYTAPSTARLSTTAPRRGPAHFAVHLLEQRRALEGDFSQRLISLSHVQGPSLVTNVNIVVCAISPASPSSAIPLAYSTIPIKHVDHIAEKFSTAASLMFSASGPQQMWHGGTA